MILNFCRFCLVETYLKLKETSILMITCDIIGCCSWKDDGRNKGGEVPSNSDLLHLSSQLFKQRTLAHSITQTKTPITMPVDNTHLSTNHSKLNK